MYENEEKSWSISIGLYPGLLLGFRSYVEQERTTHVIYLPLIDIAFIDER